jgi:uncharacterized protein
MRWQVGRRSSNVEDRRGIRMGRGAMGGGIGTILLLLLALYFGVDPSLILNQLPTDGRAPSYDARPAPGRPGDDQLADFVAVVLGDTEDTWHALFRRVGQTYHEPSLVLFSGTVESACGFAQAAMGPFYCPLDYKVYIDLSFYHDLKTRFQAPGDFAQAYVIAH